MIPLLYQLSYTAPKKIRGLRYWIMSVLSRKSDGFVRSRHPEQNERSLLVTEPEIIALSGEGAIV